MWSRETTVRLALAVVIGCAILIISLVSITDPPTEGQESIQEEGGSVIDTLQLDSYRNIRVYHDNERNVTCWIDLNKGGISCIPDHILSP